MYLYTVIVILNRTIAKNYNNIQNIRNKESFYCTVGKKKSEKHKYGSTSTYVKKKKHHLKSEGK